MSNFTRVNTHSHIIRCVASCAPRYAFVLNYNFEVCSKDKMSRYFRIICGYHYEKYLNLEYKSKQEGTFFHLPSFHKLLKIDLIAQLRLEKVIPIQTREILQYYKSDMTK